MNQLLIGTTNLAKFNDYHELLKDSGLELISLHNYQIEEPEETGKDFEENAVLKAKYYFHATGVPTLADNGGFEISALHGAPGVKSHRWLGRKSTDEELIKKVYTELNKSKSPDRNCQMRVVIAIATPFGVVTSEGTIKGTIADKPSDKRIEGYPYRSVMYLPNYKKYFVDLTKKELEIQNHRKAAIEKIKDIFKELAQKS